MEISRVNSSNPEEHARYIEGLLSSLKEHCRSEVSLFPDAHGKALLETTADVLEGLEKAFRDFLCHKEEAWRVITPEAMMTTPQQSSDPWD